MIQHIVARFGGTKQGISCQDPHLPKEVMIDGILLTEEEGNESDPAEIRPL